MGMILAHRQLSLLQRDVRRRSIFLTASETRENKTERERESEAAADDVPLGGQQTHRLLQQP